MAQDEQANLEAASLARVDDLLKSIQDDRRELGHMKNDAVRGSIISKARELVSTLETPLEAMMWMIWAEPTRTVASRLALDLKIFETLVVDDCRPKTATELAAVTGASPALVNRITRKLASMYMVDEVAPAKYTANDLTRALSIPKYNGGIRFCYDMVGITFQHMAEYLKKTNYKTPEDPTDGAFKFATGMPSPFAMMNERPELLQAFHGYVHAQTEERIPWWTEGFYPVTERLVNGLRSGDDNHDDSSAFVDLGGGTGQVIEGFRQSAPDYTGRLVLQDLASVIEHARMVVGVHDRIELQSHDFFTEQPVRGARAYHMRYILHDWSDECCLRILGHLKDAMEPGYSKILINEFVVADEGAHWKPVSLDMFMMAMCSSYERTENEWRDLIARAGLKVAGIWSIGVGNESLIEVVL